VQHCGVQPRDTDMPPPDPGGFAEFYQANFNRIATQIYAYLGDHEEAQDLTQEAFYRALDRWKVVRQYHDPGAWVRRVAWNLATSRLRRVKVALRYLARQREEVAEAPTPDRVALVQALATLPVRHRRAIVLHYLAHLSTAEIAAHEDVAEGTVRSWLTRGRAQLAAYFQEPKGVELSVQAVNG
jgi:RNA polymerase sigma-70 factor (ECF subfamily)